MKFLKKIIEKYFGKTQYVVTSINVNGEIHKQGFESQKSLNEFINEINVEKYWMVQKINKIRIFEFPKNKFIYNENIVHKSLFFYNEDICEKRIIDKRKNIEFSFIKKDKSLRNVIYRQ